MPVIVTRVQPQALRWVQCFQDRGHQAHALALIEIRALADNAPLTAAWHNLADYAAVMFVSSHAVTHFYASKPPLTLMRYAQAAIKKRNWATGPGTRAALLAQGVPTDLVDAPALDAGQYDSETLWPLVQHQIQPGAKVLIVRGDTRRLGAATPGAPGVGRDWLAQRLQAAGAQVDFLVAYQRAAPIWTAAEQALAQASAADGTVWLFCSTEALANLQALLPDQVWASARAVVTHARIAGAAQRLGFGVVSESRPDLASVLASIESMP